MTPRAPLGLTRPLTATIGLPGSPTRTARRRGAALSWRRAAKAIFPSARAHYDVHHHWPLTVKLLFEATPVQARVPSPAERAPAQSSAQRAATAGTAMLWEKRHPRDTFRKADGGRLTTPMPMPATAQPSPQPPAGHARPAADDRPAFARTLHGLVEQRWRETRTTRFFPSDIRDAVNTLARPADRKSSALRYVRDAEATASTRATAGRPAATLSSPMRLRDRELFTVDPLVRRLLRRIAVTPLHRRPAPIMATQSAPHNARPAHTAVDIAPHRATAARSRAAEQVWPDHRGGGAASLAQPFAPSFSAPAATPAIAYPSASMTAPAPPPPPDVNRLVDEVMRRIERQTRQDRLRRGL